MTYAEKLLDPRWQKRRLHILERDNWACQYCGDTETTLHVHHECYESGEEPWDIDEYLLTTLCADCHNINHLMKTKLEKWFLWALRARIKADGGDIKMLNRVIRSILENKIDV